MVKIIEGTVSILGAFCADVVGAWGDTPADVSILGRNPAGADFSLAADDPAHVRKSLCYMIVGLAAENAQLDRRITELTGVPTKRIHPADRKRWGIVLRHMFGRGPTFTLPGRVT